MYGTIMGFSLPSPSPASVTVEVNIAMEDVKVHEHAASLLKTGSSLKGMTLVNNIHIAM